MHAKKEMNDFPEFFPDTLFDVPEQLSPRRQWQRKNRIKTHYSQDCKDSGAPPWIACRTIVKAVDCYCEGGVTGFGDSEVEAVDDLTMRLGLEPWRGAW